jgi:hypothetical protein
MENGPADMGWRIFERLLALEQHRDAWASCERTGRTEIFETAPPNIFELSGGVWAMYALDKDDRGHVISFKRLPSTERNIVEENWHVDIGELIIDFTYDVAQNLLAVIHESGDR